MKRSIRLGPPPQVKPVFAIASAQCRYHDAVHSLMSTQGWQIEDLSPIYSFSEFSRYYDPELGGPAWKYLVSLADLVEANSIVAIKLLAEEWQEQLCRETPGGRQRTVNIDPGYLNGWQLVLSTVKNQAHRIFIDQGVFCEVTLQYRNHQFENLPWTYPDYRTELVHSFLAKVRESYSRQASSPAML